MENFENSLTGRTATTGKQGLLSSALIGSQKDTAIDNIESYWEAKKNWHDFWGIQFPALVNH